MRKQKTRAGGRPKLFLPSWIRQLVTKTDKFSKWSNSMPLEMGHFLTLFTLHEKSNWALPGFRCPNSLPSLPQAADFKMREIAAFDWEPKLGLWSLFRSSVQSPCFTETQNTHGLAILLLDQLLFHCMAEIRRATNVSINVRLTSRKPPFAGSVQRRLWLVRAMCLLHWNRGKIICEWGLQEQAWDTHETVHWVCDSDGNTLFRTLSPQFYRP